MKKSEFRSLIREEIKRVLAEAQLDTVNQKLKNKYIDAYVARTIADMFSDDPYDEYDFTLPDYDEIEKHAKKYGYEDTLRTIDKMPEIEAMRSKYRMSGRGVSQQDPLATKAPVKNLTKKGKMDKRDVERLKMKIKQNLNLKY